MTIPAGRRLRAGSGRHSSDRSTRRRLGAQQADLYAAEEAALSGAGQRWSRLSDAQDYLDGVVGSEWFFEQWPWLLRCRIERRGRGARWSTNSALDAEGPDGRPTEGVILLATLTQHTVLHELAHLLEPPGAGHGPSFAATLLVLVRHEMGFFAFADLAHALASTKTFRDVSLY